MYCNKCGTQNPDSASFCVKCGNNLSLKPETERKGITGKLGKMGVPGFRSGKKWKMGIAIFGYFWIGLIVLAMVFGSSNTERKTSTTQPPSLASTSFPDYGYLYCDREATNLQKQTLFDDKYKDKYVQWTGVVSSVSETWGSYTLQVKHCQATLATDIIITMKDDQKNKLLQLREGEKVTYIAKLTRYGEILGIFADEGEIVT